MRKYLRYTACTLGTQLMLKQVKEAARSIRYNDWWQTKVPFLFGIFLWHIGLSYSFAATPFFSLLAIFCWIIGAAGFGYFVNDLFDIEQDKAAGKPNMAERFSKGKRVGIIIGLLLMALLPWINLSSNPVALSLVVLHLLSFVVYSVPPIRFKERYFLGSINDALYSFALPVVIVSATVADITGPAQWSWPLLGLLFAWGFASGMRNITQHHILDRKEDARSETKNVVNTFGLRLHVNLIRTLWLPLELIFFIAYVWLWGRLPVVICIGMLLYTLWGLLPVVRINLRKGGFKFDLGLFSINGFYEHVLPMIMLGWLIVQDPWYLLVLILWQILIPNPIINFILFQFEVMFHHIVLKLLWMVRLVLSRIVNYTIYFFILLFRFLKSKITGKPREGRQQDS